MRFHGKSSNNKLYLVQCSRFLNSYVIQLACKPVSYIPKLQNILLPPPHHSPINSFLMLLKDLNNLTNFIIAAQPNRPPLMNTPRTLFQDPPRPIKRQSTRLLNKFRHRKTLIQQSQLAARRFRVAGVGEQAAVEERAVHVRDHGADVARAVGFSGRGEFDRVEVFGRGCVPEHCVSFVDGVDSAFLGDAHLRLG